MASAAGAPGNPDWYYNLAAHPDQVRIDVDGKTVDVRAEQLHGPERAQAWEQITTAAPRFAEYQVKTDRELPVIRLVAEALNRNLSDAAQSEAGVERFHHRPRRWSA